MAFIYEYFACLDEALFRVSLKNVSDVVGWQGRVEDFGGTGLNWNLSIMENSSTDFSKLIWVKSSVFHMDVYWCPP